MIMVRLVNKWSPFSNMSSSSLRFLRLFRPKLAILRSMPRGSILPDKVFPLFKACFLHASFRKALVEEGMVCPRRSPATSRSPLCWLELHEQDVLDHLDSASTDKTSCASDISLLPSSASSSSDSSRGQHPDPLPFRAHGLSAPDLHLQYRQIPALARGSSTSRDVADLPQLPRFC